MEAPIGTYKNFAPSRRIFVNALTLKLISGAARAFNNSRGRWNAKTRRRIVCGNKVLVDPIHHARAAMFRGRFRGWFRHGLRIERCTYEGERVVFRALSFSISRVTECGRAVGEKALSTQIYNPARRGCSRASRPLEITPRPCHINYRDSFRPHLQWANLAWGNLGAIPCARARTWEWRLSVYMSFTKLLIVGGIIALRYAPRLFR